MASPLDEDLAGAGQAVAAETLAERNGLVHDPMGAPRHGLVAKLDAAIAELVLEGADAPGDPDPDLAILDSAPLALRVERFAWGLTLLKAAPAINLDDDYDSRICHPHERPLSDPGAPFGTRRPAAAAPAMRRPSSQRHKSDTCVPLTHTRCQTTWPMVVRHPANTRVSAQGQAN